VAAEHGLIDRASCSVDEPHELGEWHREPLRALLDRQRVEEDTAYDLEAERQLGRQLLRDAVDRRDDSASASHA